MVKIYGMSEIPIGSFWRAADSVQHRGLYVIGFKVQSGDVIVHYTQANGDLMDPAKTPSSYAILDWFKLNTRYCLVQPTKKTRNTIA